MYAATSLSSSKSIATADSILFAFVTNIPVSFSGLFYFSSAFIAGSRPHFLLHVLLHVLLFLLYSYIDFFSSATTPPRIIVLLFAVSCSSGAPPSGIPTPPKSLPSPSPPFPSTGQEPTELERKPSLYLVLVESLQSDET